MSASVLQRPPPARSRPPLSATFRALHNRNYRLYWSGQIVSQMGTWMQRIAQAWLVLQLTNSPLALGTIATVQFSPVLVFSLFGGVLADRFPKQKLLIVSQSVMTVQALAFAILTTLGLISLPAIYVLAAVLGIASALDTPVRQAFVVEMVGQDDLPNAVALNSTQFNTSRIVGPAIGGLIVGTLGVAACFWLNAVTFLAVIAGLALMRPSEFFPGRPAAKGNVFGQIGEGLRYAVTTPGIALVVLLVGVIGLLGYNFTVLLPLIARYVLNWGAEGFGILTTAMGIGSLIAALAVAYAGRASERMLLIGASCFSVIFFCLGLSHWGFVTLPILVALGASSIAFTSTANTRLQLVTPPELRGRIMSIYSLLFMGSTPIGGLIIGVLAERIGVQRTVAVLALACGLGVVAAMLYARWIRTRHPGSSPVPSTMGISQPPGSRG
jgi:MFS family permease